MSLFYKQIKQYNQYIEKSFVFHHAVCVQMSM